MLHTLRAGRTVEVEYSKDVWYAAEVVEVEVAEEGGTTSVWVTYPGWPRKHDEWVTDAAQVRKPRGAAPTAASRRLHRARVI